MKFGTARNGITPLCRTLFSLPRAGHAIHGSFEVKKSGKAASHGCVRISPTNAGTLYGLVGENGLENTQVVLTGVTPAVNSRSRARGAPVAIPGASLGRRLGLVLDPATLKQLPAGMDAATSSKGVAVFRTNVSRPLNHSRVRLRSTSMTPRIVP